MKLPDSPLLPWREQDLPLDWSGIFGREADLYLEVGFGDGRYTVKRAINETEVDFVGLEIASSSIQRAMRKVQQTGLRNVRLLKLGANFAVQHLFAARSLSGIVVNFPDPWPKERHEKNRLLQRTFFQLAASRLKAGAEIRLATDHLDYLHFAQAEALASQLFELRNEMPPAAVFETKYALKWKKQGKPLYYQVFSYTGAPAADYPILEKPKDMPHALLTGVLPSQIQFEKQVIAYAEGHVIVHELAQSLGSEDQDVGKRWLFRVTVQEPDIKQQVLVVCKERHEEFIVRLEPFGDPLITKTMRGAVHAVTEYLLARGTLQLKARNY